jgi:hypothetical protein
MSVRVTEDQLFELLDSADEVSTAAWRHGRRVTYHGVFEGKDYLVTACVHSSEGIQDYGDLVPAVQRTREITEWVPA